jgi:hypothetical protein
MTLDLPLQLVTNSGAMMRNHSTVYCCFGST